MTIQEQPLSENLLSKIAELISPLAQELHYPESDGEPMAESDIHRDEMTDALIHPLKERYREQEDVYISGNLFFYYQKGVPSAVVASDVFVVFGISNKQRRTYKLWEENKVPNVVFELTSHKTSDIDLGKKRMLYQRLGVQEYFLFDPLRDYLEPPLQGHRLKESHLKENYYLALQPTERQGGEWELESQVLGLRLRTEGHTLRLFDPQTGQYLLNRAEESIARRAAEERAAIAHERAISAEQKTIVEAKARQEAEAEVARLQTLLAEMKGKGESG